MSAPSVAGEIPRTVSLGRRNQWLAWMWAVAALIASVVLAVVAFRPNSASSTNGLPLATARKGEFLVTVTCRGELVAERSVQLTAPNAPNFTIVWMAPPNSAVRGGDPVIRFAPGGALRQLREKEAALAHAIASVEQAKAEAAISAEQDKLQIATLEQAVQLARLEVSKSEILSNIQAEDNKITLAMAEEKLPVRKAAAAHNAASAQSKIGAAESLRKIAEAEVQLLRARISETEIRAPAAGVVNYLMNTSQGWMNAKPFKVGDGVWPGSVIAELPDVNSLQLKGKAEEIDRGRMSPGQEVRVVLDAFPEKTFHGTLQRISPLTEQSWESQATRSFRAFASLGESDSRLRPQMNGRMDVVVDRIPDAIWVPARAVFTRDGKPVVLVPDDDGVRAIPVTVLARNPDEVAVRGIEAGTQVALVDPTREQKNAGTSQ